MRVRGEAAAEEEEEEEEVCECTGDDVVGDTEVAEVVTTATAITGDADADVDDDVDDDDDDDDDDVLNRLFFIAGCSDGDIVTVT